LVLIESQGKVFANGREQVVMKKEFERVLPVTITGEDEAYYELRLANMPVIVRTMTDTTSHLPTYKDVYYEVIAVPEDRVMLENGKSVQSSLMDRKSVFDVYGLFIRRADR